MDRSGDRKCSFSNVFEAVGRPREDQRCRPLYAEVNWIIGGDAERRRRRRRCCCCCCLNGLGAGYPTVAPSSEIYAESRVNRPGQSAL